MFPAKAAERWLYRHAGTVPDEEMSWTEYPVALLWFSFAGLPLLALELAQQWVPLNLERLPRLPRPVALNTAVSFVTNTNRQRLRQMGQQSFDDLRNQLPFDDRLSPSFATIRGFDHGHVAQHLRPLREMGDRHIQINAGPVERSDRSPVDHKLMAGEHVNFRIASREACRRVLGRPDRRRVAGGHPAAPGPMATQWTSVNAS